MTRRRILLLLWTGSLPLAAGSCSARHVERPSSRAVSSGALSPRLPHRPLELARALCRAEPGDWRPLFSPSFRRAASVPGVHALLQRTRRLYGPCRDVSAGARGRYVFSYQRARVVARLVLDRRGRVAGLWIHDVIFPGDSWARLLADLGHLPGRTALLARSIPPPAEAVSSASPRRGAGKDLAALRPNWALAVASAFKLFVLKALAAEVRDGRMRWDDVVVLRRAWRSLPTAPLNRWPDGTPMTVQSLAIFMIARSDNTAADHLLLHVGREVVEQHAGTYNRPLPTTREMFLLKSRAHQDLARRWLAASSPVARRALLKALGRLPLRSVDLGWRSPRLVDRIEWFFSPRALCDAIAPLARLPVFRPNQGLASPRRWRTVAYKGGSEPGVRAIVYALQHRRTQRWACVSLVWNDPRRALDRARFDSLARRALALTYQELGRPSAAALPAGPRSP